MCVCVFLCVLLCVAYLRAASLNRCVASLVFSRTCRKNAPATNTHTHPYRATTAHAHTHTCKLVAFLRLKFHYENYLCLLILFLLVENYFSQALQSGENFSPKRRQFSGQLAQYFLATTQSCVCVCVCGGVASRGVGIANWLEAVGCQTRRD